MGQSGLGHFYACVLLSPLQVCKAMELSGLPSLPYDQKANIGQIRDNKYYTAFLCCRFATKRAKAKHMMKTPVYVCLKQCYKLHRDQTRQHMGLCVFREKRCV